MIAVSLYFWAVNSGQYDDLDAEGERLLFDNDNDKDHDNDHELSQPEEASTSPIKEDKFD